MQRLDNTPPYKPVEQREESFGRGDELHHDLQNGSGQPGGAASVVGVEAPAGLDALLQGLGNGAQLPRQTVQVLASYAIRLESTHETNTSTHNFIKVYSKYYQRIIQNVRCLM